MAARMTKEEREKRQRDREQAFCFLFEQAATGEKMDTIFQAAEEAREFFSASGEEAGLWEQVPAPFAEAVAFGAEEHGEEIDGVIRKNIRGWSFSRLSKVTLALLRLAVYEILFDETIPESVTINEAVELAKKYGGDDDAPYVNGVLSSVVKALPSGKETADE